MEKYITVGELVEKLKKFPQDIKVCHTWDMYFWNIKNISIENIKLNENHEDVLLIDVSD